MPAQKVVFAWSGGKDSSLALYYLLKDPRYEVVSLITTVTRDYDRVSLHGVRRSLIELQAEAIGLPLAPSLVPASGGMAEYEQAFAAVLSSFKEQGIELAAFGDIFLADLKKYRDDNLAKLGMRGVYPIWGRTTTELSRDFISLGFQAVATCIDLKVLGKEFAGKAYDNQFLAELPPDADPCGENGEFHTFAFAGPIFKKKIRFEAGEAVQKDTFYFKDLIPLD